MSAHVLYTYRTRCSYATYGTCTLTHAPYGVSTLTDAHSREPTVGDGLTRWRRLQTVCVRSPHVQMECLHDATARDGVCTQKCDNPRTYICLCDIKKVACTSFLPLGLYMLVRALVRMLHSGLPNILFQFEFRYIRYIYFIASLFLVV